MQSKKPVWLLENPFYQYRNYKAFIEYTGYDVYSFYNANKIDKASKDFFDMAGNKVDVKTIQAKYSVILKTGSGVFPTHIDIPSITETGKIIQMPHALIGCTVDVYAGLPKKSKNIYGIFPKAWLSNSVIKERYDEIAQSKFAQNLEIAETHPYIAKTIEPLTGAVQPNTLGLLLSNVGSVGKFTELVLKAIKRKNLRYDKIFIKRHPLNQSKSMTAFDELKNYCTELVHVEADTDKNVFFDMCQTVCTGMSSMYVEANLRNSFHKNNQKIYAVNEYNRNGMTDFLFSEQGIDFNDFESASYTEWVQYNDLLTFSSTAEIFESYLKSINNVIDRIYEGRV